MHHVDTIVIGGGQAGLALSRCLTDLGLDHLVLERGRIAQRWYERWSSLRLLTPNWMTRLPHGGYTGPDPDGFMTAAETAAFFTRYATSFQAPVLEHAEVVRVAGHGHHYTVDTTAGRFRAANVVLATGWCDEPAVPAVARRLAPSVAQVTTAGYRHPGDLPGGGVLVVGASATGVQLADEIHRSGRPVVLAVGSHTRMPRRYRGMDAFWWLDRTGSFDKTIDDCPDPVAARNEPSLQLVGRAPGEDSRLDLVTLHEAGVRLVGRLVDLDGTRAGFSPDLDRVVADAEARMHRTLARIDRAVTRLGLEAEVDEAEPLPSLPLLPAPAGLNLASAGIRSVVWATGYRRPRPWLALPVRDQRGEIHQRRGVTALAGLYVLGERFQHFRNSNFIDGVGRDAAHIAHHIAARHHRPAPAGFAQEPIAS